MKRDMKKSLIKILMMTLVIMGAFSPLLGGVMKPSVAYAEDGSLPTTDQNSLPNNTSTTTPSPQKDTQSEEAKACGFTDVGCSIIKVYVSVMSAIPIWLATGSGVVLDYTLWYTTSSSTYTDKDGVDSFVVKGWKMIRDFSNLVFIFGLLFIGFVLIFNLSGEGGKPLLGINPKRGIIQVIVMALLINFSFLMSRVMIDVSNVMARTFYSKISTNDAQNIAAVNTSTINATKSSKEHATDWGNISEIYTNVTGIRSVSLGILAKADPQRLLLKDGQPTTPNFGNYSETISTYFMVAIFNLFLTYIFISSTIFLLMRTIGLWFLTILSPLAFVSRIIPAMQKKEYFGFDDWFQQFVGLAVSAPIFLFFIYLAITFLNIDTSTSTGSGLIGTMISIAIKLGTAGIVLILGKKISKESAGKIGAIAGGVVSSVIAGGTMIAATAATGGGMAALKTTGQLFKSGAGSALRGVGNATLGKDYTDKLAAGSGDGLKRLNNFNPYKGMLKDVDLSNKGMRNLGRNIGKGAFTNTLDALGEAARLSGTTSTMPSFNDLKKQLQVEALDKKAKKIDEDLKNPNLSQDERQKLKKEKQELEKEKYNVTNAEKIKADAIKNAPTREDQQKKLTPINQQISDLEKKIANTTDVSSKQKLIEEKNKLHKEKASLEKEFTKVDIDRKQKNAVDASISKDLKEIAEELKKTDPKTQKDKFESLKEKEKGLREELDRLDKNQVTMTRLKNVNYIPEKGIVERVLTPTPLYEINHFGNDRVRVTPGTTLGDGSAPRPNYTDKQQERILNKAIRAQGSTPTPAGQASQLLSGISTNSNQMNPAPQTQNNTVINIPIPPTQTNPTPIIIAGTPEPQQSVEILDRFGRPMNK